MQDDVISIELLPDGTIKSTTDPISPSNHSSADRFFKLLTELTGGEQLKQKRSGKHEHNHTHNHSHQENKQ